MYFVLVDRFANGDPDNDGAIDLDDPHAFHGGDLQGVIDRLDDLQAMGVRTVWLSPVFAMRTAKIDEWGAFHGYWVSDLNRVEPRFGTEETLRALSDALHARGMRLVLDIVWNHTDYDAPLRTEHPDWFHPVRDIVDWDDPYEAVHHQVHGLPDLAQEQPEVAAYLREASLGWVDRVGADGFRVDAVRHMPTDFLRDMNTALDAHRPGFWTVGEDFQGGAPALAETWRAGGFDAMFDFPLRYAVVDALCHQAPLGRLASTLSQDRLYDDPSALVTFLDNHDLPRIATECGGAAGVELALGFLFAMRGTPAITYGTAAGLEGAEEPANRGDMPAEIPRDNPVQVLQERRARLPSWRDGRTRVLRLDDEVLAVARVLPGELTVVAVHRGEEPATVSYPSQGSEVGVQVARLVRSRDDPGGTWLGEEEVLLGAPVSIEPGALTVTTLRFDGEPLASWHTALGSPPPVRVRLEARVELADGEVLRAVGADPELGSWDPARGVELVDGIAVVEVPEGSVLAFKLVVVGADGAARWEERGDRYLLVEEGVAVQLVWGA